MRNGAGSRLVSGHPLRAPGPRTPHGMKSDMRNGAGSRLVSGHPLRAPGSRTSLRWLCSRAEKRKVVGSSKVQGRGEMA